MSDDLLASIIDDADGPRREPAPAAAGGIAGIIRQVAAAGAAARARQAAHDTAPLLHLDPDGWRTVVRYLDPEILVAVVARAELAVAGRLANALDQDGRLWLAAQDQALAAVDDARHQQALGDLLRLVERLRRDGRLRLADEPVAADATDAPAVEPPPVHNLPDPSAPAPAADGLVLSARMGGEPTARGDGPARDGLGLPLAATGCAAEVAATDPALVEALAAVVAAGRNAGPGQLLAIAEASPHPLLSHGLRLLAEGASAHDLTAALGHAEEAWIAARRSEAAQVRAALLALRFGESAGEFLHRCDRGGR